MMVMMKLVFLGSWSCVACSPERMDGYRGAFGSYDKPLLYNSKLIALQSTNRSLYAATARKYSAGTVTPREPILG
jgi:hypothetical protein